MTQGSAIQAILFVKIDDCFVYKSTESEVLLDWSGSLGEICI